jgi:SET domain-containing protein
MPFLEKHLEIKESNIPGAGLGLFTKEFIPKGSRIVQYKGRKRTWKDVKNEDGNFYIFYVTRNHIIDAQNYKKSFARYINDASGLQKIKGLKNNTEFVRDGNKVFVEATRDIPAGGELFVGYGKEYWEVIRQNIREARKEERLRKKSAG